MCYGGFSVYTDIPCSPNLFSDSAAGRCFQVLLDLLMPLLGVDPAVYREARLLLDVFEYLCDCEILCKLQVPAVQARCCWRPENATTSPFQLSDILSLSRRGGFRTRCSPHLSAVLRPPSSPPAASLQVFEGKEHPLRNTKAHALPRQTRFLFLYVSYPSRGPLCYGVRLCGSAAHENATLSPHPQ